MKVILTEKVATLGNVGEIVNVSPGYARNFIIPNNLGVIADDAHKKALDDLCHTLLFRRTKKCRIININPGYVRTDMVSHVPEDTPMLTAEEVADCIVWSIEQPKHIEIAELSMWRP